MHIVVAVALLVMLFAHIGRKNRSPETDSVKEERNDLNRIDELEILDVVLDDE